MQAHQTHECGGAANHRQHGGAAAAAGRGAKALPDEDSRLGGFGASAPPAGAKKARLRDKAETTTVYTERMRGDRSRDQGSREPRQVTWWSPPVFYVHKYKHMGFATVSGADYNTYAVLRRTWYEVRHELAGLPAPEPEPACREFGGDRGDSLAAAGY